MKVCTWFFLSAVLLANLGGPAAADWLQFRGPAGLAISSDKGVPVTWSADSNIAWKTALPGPGASSPIIIGERVFITCYSGYGISKDDPGEQKNLKRHLLCIERKSGKILWRNQSHYGEDDL